MVYYTLSSLFEPELSIGLPTFKWIKDKQENFHKELKFLKVEIVQVLKYNQPKNTVENLMD